MARWVLPTPGGTEHQVVAVIDKAEVQQGTDLSLGDRVLMPVIKGLQVLLRGELRLSEVVGSHDYSNGR